MSIIEIILSSNTAYVLLLYLISAKVQSRRFKETISHTLTKNVILVLHILVCTKSVSESIFQIHPLRVNTMQSIILLIS
jgi:hypothetical protein